MHQVPFLRQREKNKCVSQIMADTWSGMYMHYDESLPFLKMLWLVNHIGLSAVYFGS